MKYNIFFSPTGITEKVVKYIGKIFSSTENIDISNPDVSNYVMDMDDFCIIGVPSFGGRVPQIAVSRLQRIKGNRTPALLLVTYGGRAFEDTLKELKDVVENQNFICIGAVAMVTEHSIVSQIEAGRPNDADYEELDHFLTEVKRRLQSEVCSIEVPGNVPYKEYKVLSMEIQASENCSKCGLCARKCPVKAVPLDQPYLTDSATCISCMRCVTICPVAARKGNPAKVEMIYEKLRRVCQPDKKNEFF